MKVLIFGAASAMAEAYARKCAARGDSLYLVARKTSQLNVIAQDLKIRGAASVDIWSQDLNDLGQHRSLIRAAFDRAGQIDVALIAHGILGDQAAGEKEWTSAELSLQTNFVGPASLLTWLGNEFESQGNGTIVVISSVAGDRGRASNYIYGSAKAGLSAMVSGMRQRLWKKGIRVITIKPGFVDTPMTAAFKKGALWAKPASIADGIDRAICHGTPVAYLPWFWRWIMIIIRMIPEQIFIRIRL